jgi:predicted nucleotide-binding protein
MPKTGGGDNKTTTAKRRRISQTDVPRVTLSQALRVPRALADHYAKQPARPLDVASALEMSPTSGPFRELCGAAIGYGLTDGGPNAATIGLTELGKRVVAPLEEGDDELGRRQAALVPAVVRQFLEKYDGSPLPAERIGYNVLETMGVPEDAVERVFSLVLDNARSVGFLKQIKDKTYVDLVQPVAVAKQPTVDAALGSTTELGATDAAEGLADPAPVKTPTVRPASGMTNRRVFLSHGRNRRIVDQLKELLTFGDFEPVVSVDRETVSKPVPQKVLSDMRGASAGIIHVSSEERLLDQEGQERRVLNQNVLIEIGAAMALYADRFILLVEEGTTLPSNLQGLYQVRYSGDELGYESTMKVLKALNQFKSAPS